ncbi:hypothetical protein AZE42_05686 [Rhizopogon vesiculosus]|uniref:Amidohydrolase-related domain-containing protein n=1 Tax=Rhizopogon vesiculosus TaxID=180088 RepID=A0A1J8PRV5_9AGAM|nr:hypothetical protein AZE42_05686 [Rhizopogon vesiculosus]
MMGSSPLATCPISWRLARPFLLLTAVLVLLILVQSSPLISFALSHSSPHELARRSQILTKRAYTRAKPGPLPRFHARTQSDRYAENTKPVLVRNATIWTAADGGNEVLTGNLLMHHGLIKDVGDVPLSRLQELELENMGLEVVDADGAWVTPGIVDLHSHIGVGSVPNLNGAHDTNSHNALILPWLRSIDGLNTHDASYQLAMAGGVTTAQILPGSANNIGGQAFIMKFRPTAERSPSSMLLEPPYTLNGTHFNHSLAPRWRHMKYVISLPQSFAFIFYSSPLHLTQQTYVRENPSVRYGITRLDSGWNFRAAYDHARKFRDAQDAFCTKAESGSWDDLAGKSFPEDLQWESLIDVLRGRVKLAVHCYEAVDLDEIVRLTNEFEFPAASFHHAGEAYLVPELLKKTWGGTPTIPLFASNFRQKREAYRGSEFAPRVLSEHGVNVVIKSDHPVVNSRYLLHEAAQAHYCGLDSALALLSVTYAPATAIGMGHMIGMLKSVYIDGIPQLSQIDHYVPGKTTPPRMPNFDAEKAATVAYEGFPPPEPRSVKRVLFMDVSGLYMRSGGSKGNVEIVDLEGGTIAPGLTSFGAPLRLVEINHEPSTNDGRVRDPLDGDLPPVLGGKVMRAQDGLMFGSRNLLLAYRGGVTTAITAPSGAFLQGISTAFSPGAAHVRVENASILDDVALHVAVSMKASASVSTQIAALRNMLFGEGEDKVLRRVRKVCAFLPFLLGETTLVVDVENADIMATLLRLKDEFESHSGRRLRLTFSGGTEAHLLVHEIAKAGEYNARNMRFEVGWSFLTSNGAINHTMALALTTINLERALGVQREMPQDLVAYRGGDVFEFEAKVVDVISETLRRTDLFV